MDNSAQPQASLDTRALQAEIEKAISDLTEFRGSLKVRLGVADDQLIKFTDILKQLKPRVAGVSKSSLIERRANELHAHLIKGGAAKGWVRLTFTSISSNLKWPLNGVRPAIEYLVKHHGLKFHVGHLKTPSRFTFSKFEKAATPPERTPEPKPKPPIKRVAVKPLAALPASVPQPAPSPKTVAYPEPKPEGATVEVEDSLLEKLHDLKAKIGMASFSIRLSILALHVGYTSTQIIAAMDTLAANGEITITRFNKPAQEYFLKISEAG